MSEREQASVRVWLARIEASQDPRLALEPGAMNDAQKLGADMDDQVSDPQASSLLGWFHWYRFQALPAGQGQDELRAAVEWLLPMFVADIGIETFPEPLLPVLAEAAVPAATDMLKEGFSSSNSQLISATADLWARIVVFTSNDYPDRAGFLSNLSLALLLRHRLAGDGTDLDQAVSAGTDAAESTPAHSPNRAMYLANLSAVLLARYERSGDLADMSEAIRAATEAIRATPLGDPNRAQRLTNLWDALESRYEQTEKVNDLDQAIRIGAEAIDVTPAEHPDRVRCLSRMCRALQRRYQQRRDLNDLDKAIAFGTEALGIMPTRYPERAVLQSNLCLALRMRYEQTGDATDLDKAIRQATEAIAATPADRQNRPIYQTNLGHVLLRRYELLTEDDDVNRAISALTEAVEATPADDPDRADRLAGLGAALLGRYERGSNLLADADRAINALTEAVGATPADDPDHVRYEASLGQALIARYQRTGDMVGFNWATPGEVDQAVTAAAEAVTAARAGEAGHFEALSSLSSGLLTRYHRTGNLTDLDQAVTAAAEAVTAARAGEAGRVEALSGLSSGLLTRYDRTGNLTDLDQAIIAATEAAVATPVGHPRRPWKLYGLMQALLARYTRIGDITDLDQAVTAATEAAATLPANHPDQALYLSNLSATVRARYERTRSLDDLDQAITTATDALAVSPASDLSRILYLSSLGKALFERYKRIGDRTDLDRAISLATEAVTAVPTGRPFNPAASLTDLGLALLARYERTGNLADLRRAMAAVTDAAAATPADHPDRIFVLTNLGKAFQLRHIRTGDPVDRERMIDCLSTAAAVESAPPSERIQVATKAAALLIEAGSDAKSAARLLGDAVQLIPQASPRQLARADQQRTLQQLAGVAREAASLAISTADPADTSCGERALQLLETGRAVLLSQALDKRSDVTDLQARYPDLAERFITLRDEADRPSGTSLGFVASKARPARTPDSQGASLNRALRDRHHVSLELDSTIAEIRSLPGFQSFLTAPDVGALKREARHGPIVVFNVARYRSDALLVQQTGIIPVELPLLGANILVKQVNSFHKAVSTCTDLAVNPDQRIYAQKHLSDVLAWLWDAAMGPVLNALDYQGGPTVADDWPRVWWAPGGLLGLLPLHAAGYHLDPPSSDRRTVMDRVISSTTPTVRALGYARERAAHIQPANAQNVIVTMPATPGLDPLRHVNEEARRVSDYMRGRGATTTVLSGTDATSSAVLEQLSACGIAHFACHGTADLADPSLSRLLLHDHRSDPLTVARLTPVQLNNAALAYLSACSTALHATSNLQDEMIHLTTAFQLAGYPHVVGTLWEVDDEVAVDIADAFYANLRSSGTVLDTTRSSAALHHAIREIRDRYPATPSVWAAYLHAGA